MEGKTVIMGSVLILSLLVAQIQVEAKSCCQSTFGRNCYNICRIGDKVPRSVCASTCSCKIVEGTTCPAGWQKDILENSGSINEYCKLGCASSMCNAINTLQNSDASEEIVNGAVEQCTKACSAFCTKGSINGAV